MPALPDVTVIVPVYNAMPYLRANLDSLVGQTIAHDRLHVVTVDDGSTDGGGELLDEYAEKHPGLFTVIHQENSGGPALPCNRALDVATGRYVFFLGADDYLGEEALERLVTKADEWESDVVAGRLVGVGGRWVSQKLYAETREDVPFPSRVLASALSQTKLFRRSLIEEHGIRFLDLRPGEDQPFTVTAMLRARKISVLADYDYYFAVKREDEQNITYTSSWRARLGAMGEILRTVAEMIPPGEGRDELFGRHFGGEIATLLRRDFGQLLESDQAELVEGVNGLAGEFLTERITAGLKVLARLRYALAREGDLDGLRSLVGAEDRSVPLVLEGDDLYLAYDGFRTGFPDELFLDAGHSLGTPQVVPTIGTATLSFEGSEVVVAAPAELAWRDVRLVLVRAGRSGGKKPSRTPRGHTKPLLTAPAAIIDGALRGRLDLAEVLGGDEPCRFALRIQIDVHEHTFGFAVLAGNRATATIRLGERVVSLQAVPDAESRVLIATDSVAEKTRDKLLRWARGR